MNKWFGLALKSFIGIIVLNLIFGVLFGEGLFVDFISVASLLALSIKILMMNGMGMDDMMKEPVHIAVKL